MALRISNSFYSGRTDAAAGLPPSPPFGIEGDEYTSGYGEVLREAAKEITGDTTEDAFIAFVEEEVGMTSVAAVLERIAACYAWQERFATKASSVEASDREVTAWADLAAVAEAEIERLGGVVGMYEDEQSMNFLAGLPGDLELVVEAGIGEDDGSDLFAEAAEVLAYNDAQDWSRFATDGFHRWMLDQPTELLEVDAVRVMAASEYARERTAMVSDLGVRGQLVSDFVKAAEEYNPLADTVPAYAVGDKVMAPDATPLYITERWQGPNRIFWYRLDDGSERPQFDLDPWTDLDDFPEGPTAWFPATAKVTSARVFKDREGWALLASAGASAKRADLGDQSNIRTATIAAERLIGDQDWQYLDDCAVAL